MRPHLPELDCLPGAHQEAGMTRRDDAPQGPGGHAGERRQQFERERGLTEGPELDLPEPPTPDADSDADNGQDGARE
jgi:hypothetical protein